MLSPRFLAACAILVSGMPSVSAQLASTGAAEPQILNAVDEAERQARIAVVGDLGLPALPPVTADSPRDDIMFVDRIPTPPPEQGVSDPAVIFDGFLPPSATGTGYAEFFKYQLGNFYDPNGPPHPMVIAYHGFGSSAGSVANNSLIDEECNDRGWIYLAPTGIDDQLFGSPISQRNVEVATQWMVDNFNVDPDRIYMIGFSMGGGIATSFASRHRDPDGLMIAGVATVSASMDWIMEYAFGSQGVKNLMVHPANFGATPLVNPFAYQQVSGLVIDDQTYPPAVPQVLPELSMATNMGPVPTYVTWDSGDTLTHLPAVSIAFSSLLATVGADVFVRIKSGTVDGDGNPAPHSWLVLDVEECFDFLTPLSVDRTPSGFEAQQDLGGAVSWIDTAQRTAGAFTYASGDAQPAGNSVHVADVANAALVTVDATAAGMTAMPVHLTVQAEPGEAFDLRLTNFPSSPSYLTQTSNGQLVGGVDSDPLTGSLTLHVPAGASLDLQVVHEPTWNTALTTSPHPIAIGGTATVSVDGPAGAATAWVFVGLSEHLFGVKGVTVGVDPTPPGFIIPSLPLDPAGNLTFPADVPNDPLIQGLRLPIQVILTDSGFSPVSVSNIWGFEVL